MRIAVDAMGGDRAPATIVDGALMAARSLGVGVTLVGPRATLERELARHADLEAIDVSILDAPDVIDMEEPPAIGLRRKPHASIRVAAQAVATGDAAGFFSAGNTGATVLAAHAACGMVHGVDRPALATIVPTRDRPVVLLDAGANVECRPQHLVQFAVMGTVFARLALNADRPRVGLLSIGEEETKGNELTREAHKLLKTTALNFIGNIEARDVYSGAADVIVCDGFTGNIVLKISEGLVDLIDALLREELSTFPTKTGRVLDYSESGGAPLLGVAGVCVVGHGRSSAKAVRNGIAAAHRFAANQFIDRLARELSAIAAAHP